MVALRSTLLACVVIVARADGSDPLLSMKTERGECSLSCHERLYATRNGTQWLVSVENELRLSSGISAGGSITAGETVAGTCFKPTPASFVVEGDRDTFYPVMFKDNHGDHGNFDFEITRSNIHLDSQWYGSLMARFWGHANNGGHGSNFINAELHWKKTQFVADYKESTHNSWIVVWLRGGGTTYKFRSISNCVTLYDASATTKNARDNGTGESYVPKTAVTARGAQQGLQIHNTLTSKALAVNTGGSIESGYKMEVNGEVRIQGGVQANANYVVSDGRVKANVEPLFGSLALVRRLRGVTHTYTTGDVTAGGSNDETRRLPDGRHHGFPDGRHYGFIAQEVQAVVPELVSTLPEGLLAVQYEKLGVLLTEATKEMSSTIEAHEQTIGELRATVAEQERAIELLAERLSALEAGHSSP